MSEHNCLMSTLTSSFLCQEVLRMSLTVLFRSYPLWCPYASESCKCETSQRRGLTVAMGARFEKCVKVPASGTHHPIGARQRSARVGTIGCIICVPICIRAIPVPAPL